MRVKKGNIIFNRNYYKLWKALVEIELKRGGAKLCPYFMRWWSKRLLNIWKCEEYNNLGIVWMSFTDHEVKACSPGWYWSEAVEPLGDGASGRLLGHGSVGPWSLFPPVYWSMEWKLSLAFLTWGLTKEHLPWGDFKFVLGISITISQNNSFLKN